MITAIVLGHHHIVAEVIHPTVDIIAAVVILLQAVDTALIVMMVDIAVVRPCVIITMMNHGTMVVIGPLLVVELADRLRMITKLLEEDMAILMALLLRAVIQRSHIRRTGIPVAELGDPHREAMNTIRLGVIGDFLHPDFFDTRFFASTANILWGCDWLMMIEKKKKTAKLPILDLSTILPNLTEFFVIHFDAVMVRGRCWIDFVTKGRCWVGGEERGHTHVDLSHRCLMCLLFLLSRLGLTMVAKIVAKGERLGDCIAEKNQRRRFFSSMRLGLFQWSLSEN